MEVDRGGEESAAIAVPGRGKEMPPCPETPPSDGEDSDDSWAVSDSGSEEEEYDVDEDQGSCSPFTLANFPRVSSDHMEQTDTLYRLIPDIYRRGPAPLSIFPTMKDPVVVNKGYYFFGSEYQPHDESETSVNSAGTFDCSKKCCCSTMSLVQFIYLKIDGYRHVHPGRAKIFGFFAARDQIEPLRNYVFRRGVDNYEAVPVQRKTQQIINLQFNGRTLSDIITMLDTFLGHIPGLGVACLPLTSLVRGIGVTDYVLFEFKLCILTEGPPEDEPKCDTLIEGCTEISNVSESKSFVRTVRFYWEKCGLDVKFAVLQNAVQATVDAEILCAPFCGLNLKLYAKTSGLSDVIHLFQGVTEAGHKLSSVVAVSILVTLIFVLKGFQ